MYKKDDEFSLTRLLYEKFLTAEECDRLTAYAASLPEEDAPLTYQGIDYQKRKTKFKFLKQNPETSWIIGRIKETVEKLNQQYYHFNLAVLEDLQLLKYSEDSHFHWHMDVSGVLPFSRRKLSLIVFLSDRQDYQGGQLEIIPSTREPIPMEKGYLVLFPSYLTHRVTPVSSGTRYTLVSWVQG